MYHYIDQATTSKTSWYRNLKKTVEVDHVETFIDDRLESNQAQNETFLQIVEDHPIERGNNTESEEEDLEENPGDDDDLILEDYKFFKQFEARGEIYDQTIEKD